MPVIVDPDDITEGSEVIVNPSTFTIQAVTTGNLSEDGLEGQALYSFLKLLWDDIGLGFRGYDFPMESITPESFIFKDGWLPADDFTRKLLRSCGWAEVDATGQLQREYAGAINLGNIDPADTGYYAFSGDTTKTDFDFSGTINQGIQIFGDSNNGNFDSRSEELSLFIRTQGKEYGKATTTQIGVSTLTSIAYRFPLGESTDLKILYSDSEIENNLPFTGMGIRLFPSAQVRSIGGVDYNFGVVVDGNLGTAEEIYAFIQYELRQNSDIDPDAGPDIIGSLLDQLAIFVGNDLETLSINNPDGGGSGVYIDNFQSNDTNRISFSDNTGSQVQFPFVSAGSLLPNTNLVDDNNAIYTMYYESGFNTASSTIVEDNDGNPIQGTVSGATVIPYTYDFDNNTQNGRLPNTDVDVVVVSIGQEIAQFVKARATITRAVGQNIPLTAPLDRNFRNP